MEEKAKDDRNTLTGKWAQERETPPENFWNEEGKPERMECEDTHVNERCEGDEEVNSPQGEADEGRMVEGRCNSCPLKPHASEELEPERGPVEDNHLPEEETIGPDRHAEWWKERMPPFPFSPLYFQSVEGEGREARSDTEEEPYMAEECISATEGEGVPFMEGEEEKCCGDGHEARGETESRTE